MKSILILFSFLALPTSEGCISSQASDHLTGTYRLEGSMRYVTVEGGCWQFISDTGEPYELVGDKRAPLLKEGIQAALIVRNVEEGASICMTGTLVEVLKVIKIKHP